MPYDNDGKKYLTKEALVFWVPVAFDKLVQIAKTYGSYITYKDLGDHVTQTTGIYYGNHYRWVGKLLGPIVHKCVEDGLPPLTAFVVHTGDESVGEGYDEVFRAVGIPLPSNDDLQLKLLTLDKHAAKARYECHQFFGADFPPGGGRPTLTPRVKTAHDAKKPPTAPKFCPRHPNIQLPASGRCDECD